LYLSIGLFSAKYRFDYEEGFVITTIIVLLIILLPWMAAVVRNNAFKLYLPIDGSYIPKQFFLIFSVFFLSIFIFAAPQAGHSLKIYLLTQKTNKQELKEMYTSLQCLIPIEAAVEYTERHYYEQDQVDYSKSLIRHHHDRRYEMTDDMYDDKIHYRNINWLAKYQKDSIRNKVHQIIEYLNRFDIRHNLNADTITDHCFLHANRAPVFVAPSESKMNQYPYNMFVEYSSFQHLAHVIYSFNNKKELDEDIYFVVLILSMVFTFLFSSFRLMKTRLWLLSLMFMGISTLLFVLFHVAIETGSSFRMEYWLTLNFCLLYCLLFFAFMNFNNTRYKKSVTGIILNMLYLFYPLFIYAVFGFLFISGECHSYGGFAAENCGSIYLLGQELGAFINYVLVPLILFSSMMIFPWIYRKWQGLPEN